MTISQAEYTLPDSEDQAISDEPVGSGEYSVKQGDCIESIAFRSGHYWQTIWNDPANAGLKSARRSANILLAGDRLHIPARRTKEVERPTDQLHKFVRRGVACMLRLRVLQGGIPCANERYTLTVNGVLIDGTTGHDGELEAAIPPNAVTATLKIGAGLHERIYHFELGGMDPADTKAGLHKRLHNLGYCGPAADSNYEDLGGAIASFQQNHGIKATGVCDAGTADKLIEQHGS